MTNVLEAICNISNLEELVVKDITFGNNRATNVGDGLETFVKDAFANTFGNIDKKTREDRYQEEFSYQGNSRNPPDFMLKAGDAIEVKKTESLVGELQLNSSYPKAKLFSTSSLISKQCKECEAWEAKDFIYIIGHLPKGTKKLSSLWIIDGTVYSADEKVYIALKEALTKSLEATPTINFSPTKEIGRVNEADQLNITNLRIRGMWLLKPPYRVFKEVHGYDDTKKFQCICILPIAKYKAYPRESITKIEEHQQITITDIAVKDPNDPAKLLDCKLIKLAI